MNLLFGKLPVLGFALFTTLSATAHASQCLEWPTDSLGCKSMYASNGRVEANWVATAPNSTVLTRSDTGMKLAISTTDSREMLTIGNMAFLGNGDLVVSLVAAGGEGTSTVDVGTDLVRSLFGFTTLVLRISPSGKLVDSTPFMSSIFSTSALLVEDGKVLLATQALYDPAGTDSPYEHTLLVTLDEQLNIQNYRILSPNPAGINYLDTRDLKADNGQYVLTYGCRTSDLKGCQVARFPKAQN